MIAPPEIPSFITRLECNQRFLRLYDRIPHGVAILLLRIFASGTNSVGWIEMKMWGTTPQLRELHWAANNGWLKRVRQGRKFAYYITHKAIKALTPNTTHENRNRTDVP